MWFESHEGVMFFSVVRLYHLPVWPASNTALPPKQTNFWKNVFKGSPDPPKSRFNTAIWKSVFFYLGPQIFTVFNAGVLGLWLLLSQFFTWNFDVRRSLYFDHTGRKLKDNWDILVSGDREKNSLSHPCWFESSATDSLRISRWPSPIFRRFFLHRAFPVVVSEQSPILKMHCYSSFDREFQALPLF